MPRFNNANRAVAARCTVCSPHETYHTMNSFAMSRTDARNITKDPTDPGRAVAARCTAQRPHGVGQKAKNRLAAYRS